MPKLSELGKILTGITPATSNTSYYDSFDIPFVKPSDIPECTIGSIIRAEHYIAESARSKAKIVPVDSILVTCIGTIGKTAIARKECAFNQQINAIVPNKTLCNTDYLARAVWFEMQKARNIANAPVVPIINKTQFSNIYITLPPLKVQLKIAQTLSKVDALLALCEKFIIQLETLIKSRFVETFGDPIDEQSKWPRKPIKDFCELRIGPFGSALHKQDYIVGGHPLVNPSHIVDGCIVPSDELTISDEKYGEMDAYHLALGDVVLGRRGEIGRCAVVCDEGYLCGTGSMIVRPGQECRSDYLQRVLSFPSFKDALERNAVGQTMKNLNAKIVGNAVVALPAMQAQQEFAAFVQQVDKLRFDIQRQIEKLETLKKSLMQEYFG